MQNTGKLPAVRGLAAAALAFGLAAPPAIAQEEFILAHAMNTDHVFHAISERFMEELGDDSGVSIAYHPGGDLGDWVSLFEQSMQGVVPMTLTWASSDFDKRLDLIYLGYIVSDWDEAKQLYGPGAGMLDVYNDMLADLGIHAVGIIPTDFGSVVIRKGVGELPVNFPDDPAGMKIRVPGLSIAVDRFNDFGFAAVPIPLSEVHTALQLGTVDARSFSTAVETYTLRDVLEANILTNDYFEVAFWLVNKSWWDGLPDDVRANLQAAADETIAWSWEEAERKSDEFLQKAREAGINVVELSDDQMNAAKRIVYENEWPMMESVVGKDIIDRIRSVVGIE
ncbi:MAG: TRAP transporter substrate-binding protein DctP [Boseongicola sp.]|nr:TRAP transporter substrate-binding protein DctP [Boseongicola sp.]